MESTPVLSVDGLSYAYGRTPALRGVDLRVGVGSVHAVLGPNGAGKSTTIACAVGLLRPDSGTVRILGHDPVTERAVTAAATGVMLQDGGLPLAARPLEVLHHLARLHADPLDVDALAERLGITGFASRTIRRLSGGQRQRVGLAAALVGRPRLVFLDEPTAGLDPQAGLVVAQVIRELAESGTAVVLTTHDMADAQDLADEVTVIDHGTVVAAGTLDSLVHPAAGDQLADIVLDTSSLGAPGAGGTLESPAGAALMEDLRPFGTVAVSGDRVTITGDFTPATLAGVTAVLAEHDLRARSFSLQGRTLEDVFLDLTGRALRS
ncbi:ABC transporter ATP-binding protein [Brevibacterium litoralis]|uniref:ABC transporter ATP-binding protein n=1 Tax=Brevibacterium litoralis TaxID=3138935 RepID=UPI0032F05808